MINTTMERSTALEYWLKQATCSLSAASRDQIRAEIQEHYESAYEDAAERGATHDDADHTAVTCLGDAKAANRKYREVLLTKGEARLLREVKWEARAVCSLQLKRWFFLLPGAGLGTAIAAFLSGRIEMGWMLLAGAFGVTLLVASPHLPIYTPQRARVFRAVRWAWLAAVLLMMAWPDVLKQSWLIASVAWPLIWIEWTLHSLRRKLPVAEWPKQLFL